MNYRAIMDDGAVEARKGAPCQLAEFDVICTRCVMAKKHPGNDYYLQLVRDYKQKLGTRTTSMPFEKVSVDLKRNYLALSLVTAAHALSIDYFLLDRLPLRGQS
jgi:hypothetical protein